MNKVSFVRTTDLLALTVILDRFEQFDKEVKKLLEYCYGIYDISKLKAISNNEKVLGNRKLKEFYIKNKETIDLINICSDIYSFIVYNYNSDYELNNSIAYLYNYLLNNKENTFKITNLLLKVYKLGFDYILFNEYLDFTKNEYNAYFDEFTYLDNMYVVPTYKGNSITYKTKDSNFEMKLKRGMNKVYPVKITFNSLLVDSNKLPESLTKEDTYGKIVELKDNIQKDYDSLRESINLSLGADELRQKYEYILNIASMCDDKKIKEKLLSTLSDINEDILELEYMINKYGESIVNNNELLSEANLQKEKEKELKRRQSFYKHLD